MIRVVEDKVAIVPLENPDMTPSGKLWIPDQAKDRLNQGFVKYIGPDVVDVKVGAYVIFSGYSGSLVHVTNEGKLIILPESFVIAELSMGDDELKEIPGVYFHSPIDRAEQFRELWGIMKELLPGLEDSGLQQLVSGLCKYGVTGPEAQPFFAGNYELIMEHVARAFAEDVAWRGRVQVVNKTTTLEDIELAGSKKHRPEGIPSI